LITESEVPLVEQDQFIKEVNKKYARSPQDTKLIQVIREIRDYFSSLSGRIGNTTEKLIITMNTLTWNELAIKLGKNSLHFLLQPGKITISFLSLADNRYTKKGQILPLDELVLEDRKLIVKSTGEEFDIDMLDRYLEYLLA
jgi:hypothetical protein